MTSRKRKTHRRHPETIDQPPRAEHRLSSASVPARLIDENRTNSNSIISALTKTAVALSLKEGGVAQVEIMERLFAMQRAAEDRQAEREFGIAKVALAMELPTIPKRHKISFTDKNNVLQEREYADRVDIESVLDPLCRKHGFSKEYSSHSRADSWACQILTVRHVGGHKVVFESPYMPLDTSGAKNNNQGAGSTAEYGKRYAVVGAFNIINVDWDDDGNNAKEPGAPKGDKFTERVQEQAATPQAGTHIHQEPPKPNAMTLPEAAGALEEKINKAPQEKRGAILMKHITIVGAMEKDTNLSVKAAELRKLCEEVADVGVA